MFFGHATPILRVSSLRASVDYYVKVLGFALDWEHGGNFAAVSRGSCTLFLCDGDQGNPGTWVWIGVGDADALCEAFRARGARVRHPPTNYSWAYEMQIEDPDGHVLRFGSDSKAGQPFGPWLDMQGVEWTAAPDGGWTRGAPA